MKTLLYTNQLAENIKDGLKHWHYNITSVRAWCNRINVHIVWTYESKTTTPPADKHIKEEMLQLLTTSQNYAHDYSRLQHTSQRLMWIERARGKATNIATWYKLMIAFID